MMIHKMQLGWEMMADGFIHCPAPVIDVNRRGLEKWAGGRLYPVPVSQRYNGGIVVKLGEAEVWAHGFKVPAPAVPEGWELVSIHCGAQLNACPPVLPMLLRKKS